MASASASIVAAVLEQRQQRAELGELDIIAEIDAGPCAADAGEHRPDREDVGLAPLVAPGADHVAAQEVARFVRDHAGQLGLVAHAQQQAREDHREAAREHHRVEVGDARQVDAEILRRRTADGADDVP